MLRPVGKLSVTLQNQKTTDAVTITGMSLGDARPHTGYVFKHDAILPKSATNTYHSIGATDTHNIFPTSSQLVFETLLYETIAEEGFNYSISYQDEADYDFQENLSGNLQHISNGDPFLVKIQNVDLFLRLEQTSDGGYNLGVVTALELDDKCIWSLSSNGKQVRGFTNEYYDVSLKMENRLVSFSSSTPTFKYGGGNDYTIIGEGGSQLTYNATTKSFSATSNGTPLQFFQEVETSGGGIITPAPFPILVQNIINDELIPLTTIHRNQHIQLNIIFK